MTKLGEAMLFQAISRYGKRALSSVGSERLPYKQRVGGSNPSAPTYLDDKDSLSSFFIVNTIIKKCKNISCSTLLFVFVPHKMRIFALRIE